jgi:crotonobetaine/carnitine-CoA ligase
MPPGTPAASGQPAGRLGLALTDMVVGRLLEQRAAEHPGRPFVSYGSETATFGDVDAAAGALAAGLAAAGIGRGDRVGLMLGNGAPFISTYFALGKLGAVAVPINPAYRGYMLEYVLADTGCRLLIVAAAQLAAVAAALEGLDTVPGLAVAGPVTDAPAGMHVTAFSELSAPSPVPCADRVGFADTNCVIYTSGTTGPSKGVPVSNAHAVAKAIEVIRICEITEQDVIYSPLPLFHSMALLRGVLAALVAGAHCVLRDRFSVSQYWDDVRRTGATVGHCVFTIPQLLKKAEPSDRDRDHPLRCLYNARYDAEFEERFGVRLIEGYGLTEAGVAMYMRMSDPPHPGSCGRISPDWEVQLSDDSDQPVPQGQAGEILLRPKSGWLVTAGYLNKPEATVAAFRNLWFHTGDLASVDGEGYYYFKDRKKDSIRRRGENVSSWEIEQVMREHPAVDEAAAVPYPSPVGEDDIRVFVTLRAGISTDALTLIGHCERRLPPFMVPRYLEIAADLPRTPTGRIRKHELRERPLGPHHHDRGDPREPGARAAGQPAPRSGW